MALILASMHTFKVIAIVPVVANRGQQCHCIAYIFVTLNPSHVCSLTRLQMQWGFRRI